MPFLRLTRDHRGYENTYLLHIDRPGDRPRVLYLYRSAPGVRVGRPALDEDAIRTIEEQHPEIEFDWPHILESGAMLPPEVERRPERPRRKAARARDESRAARPEVPEAVGPPDVELPEVEPGLEPVIVSEIDANGEDLEEPAEPAAPPAPRASLLEQLVGREIATRLHARYAEVEMRVHAIADPAARAAWQVRAEALNPDTWVTPEEILRGVEHADRLFDELRRDIAAATSSGAS